MRPRGESALGCCGLCTCPTAAGGKGGLGQEIKGALGSGSSAFYGWFGIGSLQQLFPVPKAQALGRGEGGVRVRADLCACIAGLPDAPLMHISLPGAQVVHTHDSQVRGGDTPGGLSASASA